MGGNCINSLFVCFAVDRGYYYVFVLTQQIRIAYANNGSAKYFWTNVCLSNDKAV